MRSDRSRFATPAFPVALGLLFSLVAGAASARTADDQARDTFLADYTVWVVVEEAFPPCREKHPELRPKLDAALATYETQHPGGVERVRGVVAAKRSENPELVAKLDVVMRDRLRSLLADTLRLGAGAEFCGTMMRELTGEAAPLPSFDNAAGSYFVRMRFVELLGIKCALAFPARADAYRQAQAKWLDEDKALVASIDARMAQLRKLEPQTMAQMDRLANQQAQANANAAFSAGVGEAMCEKTIKELSGTWRAEHSDIYQALERGPAAD